jgi:uncharacterized protein YecE (DUF72 family)
MHSVLWPTVPSCGACDSAAWLSASAFPAGATSRGGRSSIPPTSRSIASSNSPRARFQHRDQRLVLFAAIARELAAWREATPADFEFSVKGPRYVTHILRLKNCCRPLANFFASGRVQPARETRADAVAVPAIVALRRRAFREFFALLPRDTEQALNWRARRDRACTAARHCASTPTGRCAHAVEIRHASFAIARNSSRSLRAHRVALVVADTAGKWPYLEDVTADFMYLRLHGDKELYASGYTDAALDRWAGRIRAWVAGASPRCAACAARRAPPRTSRDVYCYFDNDVKVRAPFDADRLMQKLGSNAAMPRSGFRTRARCRTSRR